VDALVVASLVLQCLGGQDGTVGLICPELSGQRICG
jgi:hypothetical protein